MTKKSTKSNVHMGKKGLQSFAGGFSKDGSRTVMSTKSALPSRKPTATFEMRNAQVSKKLTMLNESSPTKPTPDASTTTIGHSVTNKMKDMDELGTRHYSSNIDSVKLRKIIKNSYPLSDSQLDNLMMEFSRRSVDES